MRQERKLKVCHPRCVTLMTQSYSVYISADHIDIISRSPKSLQEDKIALDRAARRMGLEINQEEIR